MAGRRRRSGRRVREGSDGNVERRGERAGGGEGTDSYEIIRLGLECHREAKRAHGARIGGAASIVVIAPAGEAAGTARGGRGAGAGSSPAGRHSAQSMPRGAHVVRRHSPGIAHPSQAKGPPLGVGEDRTVTTESPVICPQSVAVSNPGEQRGAGSPGSRQAATLRLRGALCPHAQASVGGTGMPHMVACPTSVQPRGASCRSSYYGEAAATQTQTDSNRAGCREPWHAGNHCMNHECHGECRPTLPTIRWV